MGFEIENEVLKKYTEEEGVTEVVIPDGVTSIGDGAFRWCGSLTSITIPDSVTSIGYGAFSCCESLTSVTIPKSVTSIGESAFSGCKNLTSVKILESVISIGVEAFYACENLTSIIILASVTSIEMGVFAYCKNLKSITISESVTSIGDKAFYECESLTSITILESVPSIDYSVFSGCKNLKSFIFRNKEYYVTVCADFFKSDGSFKADTEAMFKFVKCKNDENFAAVKKAEFKIPMALLWYFKDENETAKEYIKKNIKKVAVYLAENKNVAMIYKVLPLGFITKKNATAIVDAVIEATDNAEIRAIFLNYKHENFGERDIFKELELL